MVVGSKAVVAQWHSDRNQASPVSAQIRHVGVSNVDLSKSSSSCQDVYIMTKDREVYVNWRLMRVLL